jgi:hypothetical protein
MLLLDHLAIWAHERDTLVRRLAEFSGCPALDGYAPFGPPVARGVRLAGGAFFDIHQAEGEAPAGHVLIGLRGSIDKAERLATGQGWRFRVGRWRDATDGSPWSLLSFRRGQGVLSRLFVIDYATEPQAWTSPAFNRPLYRAPAPREGARLVRVWLQATDPDDAARVLMALGFTEAGEMDSAHPPSRGQLFRGVAGDLVLTPGTEDAIVRCDLDGPARARAEAFGEGLSIVVGESP